MLFQRVVIDVAIDASGRLRPRAGAAWRPEPARGETSIHRRLAGLVDATDAQIAAFASAHGFLRVQGDAAFGGRGPASVAATVAIGQEAIDDGSRVEEWFNSGAVGSPPPATEDTVLVVELYAALPEWVFEKFESQIDGEEPDRSIDPAQFFAVVLPVAAATRKAMDQYRVDPDRFRRLDPTRVRRAFRLNEWVNRVVGGLDDLPESLAGVGGVDGLLRQLIAAAPDLFIVPEHFPTHDADVAAYLDALGVETVNDWRTVALEHRDHIRFIDLVRRALRPAGISPADKQELASLHADVAGFRSPPDLAAAEIADRSRPLLAAALESKIGALGAWPIRRGTIAGVQVRSLVAAWTELTAKVPLAACDSPGCAGTLTPTRNRRYCDECQVIRRREAVRRTRRMAQVRALPIPLTDR